MRTTQFIPFNFTYDKTAVSSYGASLIIREAKLADVDLILEMHKKLSTESLYKRYHSPRIPTRKEIESMCNLNNGKGRVLIAEMSGVKTEIVGMAYYVTNAALPIAAEVALLVADDHQQQGLGRKLMNHLVKEALSQQIRFFDGYIQTSNQRMIHLLNSSGKLIENHISYGTAEMRVQLSDGQASTLIN